MANKTDDAATMAAILIVNNDSDYTAALAFAGKIRTSTETAVQKKFWANVLRKLHLMMIREALAMVTTCAIKAVGTQSFNIFMGSKRDMEATWNKVLKEG